MSVFRLLAQKHRIQAVMMTEAALIIAEPGQAMSVQGRPFRTARHHGVPLCGPADPIACAMANWIAGNPIGSAALEWAVSRFKGHVTQNISIGVSGAVASVLINGQPHNSRQTTQLKAGDHIEVAPSRFGARLYLAVSRGFAVDTILGSTASYPPAQLGTASHWSMGVGDALAINPSAQQIAQRILPERCRQSFSTSHVVRYVPAAGQDPLKIAAMTEMSWRVTPRFDRTGVQLTAASQREDDIAPWQPQNANTHSNAVFPGAIQLPPDGKPMLLGVDCRTTGGYAMAGQIIRADRHLLGQMRSNDSVRLMAITAEKARQIYLEKTALWRRYLPDIRLD